jgi:hypothetical protein
MLGAVGPSQDQVCQQVRQRDTGTEKSLAEACGDTHQISCVAIFFAFSNGIRYLCGHAAALSTIAICSQHHRSS